MSRDRIRPARQTVAPAVESFRPDSARRRETGHGLRWPKPSSPQRLFDLDGVAHRNA